MIGALKGRTVLVIRRGSGLARVAAAYADQPGTTTDMVVGDG
jgi:hypothetical protein